MKRLLLILVPLSFLVAATWVPWAQVNSKLPKTGTFVLTGVNGVISWVAPTPVTPPVGSNFSDAEVPSGTLNGTNAVFTLAHVPVGTSLELVVNGIVQQATNDYTLSGSTITFNSTSYIPNTGDAFQAWYRY